MSKWKQLIDDDERSRIIIATKGAVKRAVVEVGYGLGEVLTGRLTRMIWRTSKARGRRAPSTRSVARLLSMLTAYSSRSRN